MQFPGFHLTAPVRVIVLVTFFAVPFVVVP